MKYIPLIVSFIAMVFGYILISKYKKASSIPAAEKPSVSPKLLIRIGLALCVFGAWQAVGSVITLIFGSRTTGEFTVNIIPPRVNFAVFGYYPSETMVVGWGVMAVILIAAVVLRIFYIPKLSDEPCKFQNIAEAIVEAIEDYTSARTTDLGRPMFGYVFAIGATLLGNAVAELMGFRSPSSDLMFTLALAFFAFFMANWYGIRKRSIKGRLQSLMHPTPLLLPIRLVTDLANPLSMACRLFGNTISGMIVMNLIYSVLGNFAAGIPSVVGLYFNVFAALIQTVIFITLALSSINETTVEPEI